MAKSLDNISQVTRGCYVVMFYTLGQSVKVESSLVEVLQVSRKNNFIKTKLALFNLKNGDFLERTESHNSYVHPHKLFVGFKPSTVVAKVGSSVSVITLTVGSPRISKSYENLVVRLRFAKALRAEVEGNLGDKITNLYDSQSLKESIKLLAASYTEDKKFILRMHRTQPPTAKGAEYTDYYGVFMKDSKKAKTLAYVSEDEAHFNENVTREPMPEVLKDGLMGMFGIVKYTAKSARVTLNVKITDSSILVDIM